MDATHVWQAALERVRHRVSPAAYSTWFAGTVGCDLAGCRLTVGVPSTFAGEHLRTRFAEMARIAVSEVIGQRAEITFVVQASASPIPPPPPAPVATHMPAPTRAPTTPPRRAVRAARGGTATPQLAQQVAVPHEPHAAPPLRSPRPTGRPAKRAQQATAHQPALVAYDSALPAPVRAAIALATPKRPEPAPYRGATLPYRIPEQAVVVPDRLPRELPAAPSESHELHPRYRFETYIVGTSNRLAYAAAQEVASSPGEQYNPLFLYGGVGLGKTHLLHAIGHRALRAGLSVAYVTAERFTNEIIEAIRLRTTDAFRRRYRAVDVLLVDDVQFIAGKESTEEEFFHTFNTLHDANKQIVLSSDRVPHAMPHLHDRLRSRFQWGLMADIQAPDVEQRVEILRTKAAALHIPLPEDVLHCLARPECENIRALEGALNRVVAHAQMLKQPLDVRLVEQALAPLAAEQESRPVEPGAVLVAVGRYFGLSLDALLGKSREHAIAWARQIAMYLLREETPASLLQIGQQLGGRDHTTVMHGCLRVSQALALDDRARADVSAIRAMLHG